MKRFRSECRVCWRDSALNSDEMVQPHGPRNQRCKGSGRPPFGDPPCGFGCGRMAGRVSWPEPYQEGQPHASTYVCYDPNHQAEGVVWVRSKTGHDGVFVGREALVKEARSAVDHA